MTSMKCSTNNPGCGERFWLLVGLLGFPLSQELIAAASVGEFEQLLSARSPQKAEALRKRLPRLDCDAEIELLVSRCVELGISRVTIDSVCYPEKLREIEDPPAMLFVQGEIRRPAVAIVGARKATDYGRATAKQLAGQLAARGVTIVSGLAVGIDSEAHRGALASAGQTVAVLGSGHAACYPAENRRLAMEIVEHRGAVISEYAPDVKAARHHFPNRNRIISGISEMVVVVEASHKSGSLITAKWGAAQGREIFAVPGRVDWDSSSGTNALIKNGAAVCTDAQDLVTCLERLGIVVSAGLAPSQPTRARLDDPRERRIYGLLSDEPQHLDQLSRSTGYPSSTVSAVLLTLELQGSIRRLEGNRYRLVPLHG